MKHSSLETRIAAVGLLALSSHAHATVRHVETQGIAAESLRTRDAEVLTAPVFDTSAGGEIWVRGRTYKARFDRHGFEYVPFLGSDAPRDYPVDFKVESARVGSTELGWQPDVAPELEGATVTFHRGAFDEVYVVGIDSIEQNFVVCERGTAGDLVVSVHAETELRGADASTCAAFGNELGGVEVGKASIRDAQGRQVRSLTRLAGESVEIRVPQGELQAASFPLAIDPLITTWTVTLIAAPTSNYPDTSYDWWTDTWLCIDQETFSATDHDIVARQFTSGGTMVNQVFIESGTADWTRARVANENAQHLFMVVAEVAASTPTGSVQARTYSATAHSLGAPFTVSPNKPNHKFFCPDIGGDDNPNGTPPFCVAYLESPNELNGDDPNSFNANATVVSPSGRLLSQSALEQADAEPLRVSKSNGHYSFGLQRWTVAWPFGVGSGQFVARFVQIDSSGSNTFADFSGGTIGTGYNAFAVSSLLNGSAFPRGFAFAIAKGAAFIEADWVDSNGSRVTFEAGYADIAPSTAVSVDTDGTNIYLVSAQPIAGPHGSTQNNLYLYTFHPSSTDPNGWIIPALQDHVLIAGATDDESMPSLASMRSSGGGSSNMLCIYKRTATLGGAASILAAMLY